MLTKILDKKQAIKKFKESDNILLKFIYHTLLYCWRIYQIVFKSEIRTAFIGKIKYKERYFQQSTYTSLNRYPLLFQLCEQYFKSLKSTEALPQKLLSFGCSTGEEVYTLGQLFPMATIIGVDINNWCLAKCKKKYANPNSSFLHSQSEAFETMANFDAIFCLAVLQHTQNRSQEKGEKATAFTFEQFEAILLALDKKLKRGGLLVIDHTDFSFLDTILSKAYKVYEIEGNKATRTERKLYNQNNELVMNIYEGYRIFIKN